MKAERELNVEKLDKAYRYAFKKIAEDASRKKNRMKDNLRILIGLLLIAALFFEILFLAGPWIGIPLFILIMYEVLKDTKGRNGKNTDEG
jgi:uncharacterized membrane protein SirB2